MKKRKTPVLCPCGSHLDYRDCCGRFHEGALAPDALALMKSRYSAFAMKRADYLLKTWHESTRPADLDLNEPIKWLGLEILSFDEFGDEATVVFVAKGKISGRAFKQSEKSRFVKQNGQWYYVDGVMDDEHAH